jgi:cytochrome b
VRTFHWTLAASCATAFVIEDRLLGLHVWAGYLALTLIGVRLVWGLIGTRHARFSDFVRRPSAVLVYARQAVALHAPRYLGHNPAGGAMVVALLLSVAATGVSGLMLYGAQEFAGPLADLAFWVSDATAHRFEDVHAFFANFTLALVMAHLAGVVFSSLSHRENLIGAMITGNKRRED